MERTVSSREGVFDEQQGNVPVAHEIQQWTTSKATGYIQQVEVLVRERETGAVISVPYSSVSNDLRSRAEIVAQALDVYSDDNAQKYNQQVLGAVYSGTYRAVPAGE